MPLPTIEQAMGFCRAEEEDQDSVQLCLDGAIDAAQGFMNRKLFNDQEALDAAVVAGLAGDFPLVADNAACAAILLACAYLYTNRDQAGDLPDIAKNMLRTQRIKYAL